MRVSVREPVEDLRGRLDYIAVVERSGAHALAKGLAGDELVRDVNVPLVVGEREGAQAIRVPEARGRGRLALGARSRLSLSRHDLQGHVEPRGLVAREPDRARASAAERAQGAIAAEDELRVLRRCQSGGHGGLWVGAGPPKSLQQALSGRPSRYSASIRGR